MRAYTARFSAKQAAFCVFVPAAAARWHQRSGISRVTATSACELGWVEVVASRALPVLDILVVMISTGRKVLTELQEA